MCIQTATALCRIYFFIHSTLSIQYKMKSINITLSHAAMLQLYNFFSGLNFVFNKFPSATLLNRKELLMCK